jgi:hypothetical protein
VIDPTLNELLKAAPNLGALALVAWALYRDKKAQDMVVQSMLREVVALGTATQSALVELRKAVESLHAHVRSLSPSRGPSQHSDQQGG